MAILHDRHMRSFVAVWRRAKAAGIPLPETDDPAYASLEALLWHILRASRGYMTWICENLDLPDPAIDPVPDKTVVEARADAYLEHLLDRWPLPLRDLPGELFEKDVYKSRWGVAYCIDAMLEHAVMHPLRHEFQLRELLGESPDVAG